MANIYEVAYGAVYAPAYSFTIIVIAENGFFLIEYSTLEPA